jgi:hypothetical protein
LVGIVAIYDILKRVCDIYLKSKAQMNSQLEILNSKNTKNDDFEQFSSEINSIKQELKSLKIAISMKNMMGNKKELGS